MAESLKELFKDCDLSSPASEDSIRELEEEIGVHLPVSYVDLLKFSNGVERSVGEDAYIVFWPVEDVAQNNKDYKTEEFIPGLLLIGSDGGGEAIGIDLREKTESLGSYYQIPFITLDWGNASKLGETITELVRKWSKNLERN